MSSTEKAPSDEAVTANKLVLATIQSRILAMLYDGLIILFITTLIVFVIEVVVIGDTVLPTDHLLNKILKPFWFVPGFFYLAHYWLKGGQTPSMKIWKVKLVNHQNQSVSWPQALIRYVSALLGLGLLWVIFNKERTSLQDVISKTYLVNTNQ